VDQHNAKSLFINPKDAAIIPALPASQPELIHPIWFQWGEILHDQHRVGGTGLQQQRPPRLGTRTTQGDRLAIRHCEQSQCLPLHLELAHELLPLLTDA
jgi:hypothetical protein